MFSRRVFLRAMAASPAQATVGLSVTTAKAKNDTQVLVVVESRVGMKQLDPNANKIVFLKEGGRSGTFEWVEGDYAKSCALDRNEAIFVSSLSVPAIEGAWIRLGISEADLRWFGATGNYEADDTDAVEAWLEFWDNFSLPLFIPSGVFRCTSNLLLPNEVIIRGVGAPRIASFPQYDAGDKSKLARGKKASISGSSLIFSGEPKHIYSTNRTDGFASITPCLIYDHFAPPRLSSFGIIQDVDVLDETGTLTTVVNDRRASAYSAGLLSRATLADFERITVFGLFSDAGTILVNRDGDGPGKANDPDYPTFDTCLLSGGVAIVGGDKLGPLTEGNTGSRFVSCGIFGADHHTRSDSDPQIPCLFIDVALTTKQQGRGHTFEACNFRTVSDRAIVLDHCNDISIIGGVTEFSSVDGVEGLSRRGVIVGSKNTQNVLIAGLASTNDLGLTQLRADIAGTLQVLGTAGQNTDAMLEVENLVVKRGKTLKPKNGVIFPTQTYHLIDGAEDHLIHTIDFSFIKEDQILRFRRAAGQGTKVCFAEMAQGNLVMASKERLLSASLDVIEFSRIGTKAVEEKYVRNG